MYSFYLLIMSTLAGPDGSLWWDFFTVTDIDDLRYVVEHDWEMRGRVDHWRHDPDEGEVCLVRVCQSGQFEAEVDLRPLVTPRDYGEHGDPRQDVDWDAAAIPPLRGEPLPQVLPIRVGGVVYRHGHIRAWHREPSW